MSFFQIGGGRDISGVRKSKISSKLTAHNILCEEEQIIKIKPCVKICKTFDAKLRISDPFVSNKKETFYPLNQDH